LYCIDDDDDADNGGGGDGDDDDGGGGFRIRVSTDVQRRVSSREPSPRCCLQATTESTE